MATTATGTITVIDELTRARTAEVHPIGADDVFAVHPDLDWEIMPPEEKAVTPCYYTLTHVPTGCKICDFEQPTFAERAARELRKVPLPWESSDVPALRAAFAPYHAEIERICRRRIPSHSPAAL